MFRERISFTVRIAGLLVFFTTAFLPRSFSVAGDATSASKVQQTSAEPFRDLQRSETLTLDFVRELADISDLVRQDSAVGEERATEIYRVACIQKSEAAAAVALIQRACARIQQFGLQAGIEDYRSSLLLMPADSPRSLRVLFLQGVCRFERFTGRDRYRSRLRNLRRLLGRPGDHLSDHVRLCGAYELLLAGDATRDSEEAPDSFPSMLAQLSADSQFAAFERVHWIRRSFDAGVLNTPDALATSLHELMNLSDRVQMSELVIHHSFLTADIAAKLSLASLEQSAIDRGLEASMKMGSETYLAECLVKRARSLTIGRKLAPQASSIRSMLISVIHAINDRDVLRYAVEVLAMSADADSSSFVADCIKRIGSLNAIIVSSAHDFPTHNEKHLENIIDNQAVEILSREEAARNAHDRSFLFAQIGFAVLCGLSLILLKDRWNLRKMNLRLQEEIAQNERQRIERERIELRLAQTERLESLGAIAGGIAHDFNNLLVGVIGNADLLRQELTLSETGHSYIDGIVRSAETAADLSHKMLAYAGRQPSTKRVLELNSLLERMIPLFRAGLGNRHVVQFSPSEEKLFTRADLAQLEQIAMNLVTNALQAMGDRNGFVQITTGSCSFEKIPVDLMTIGNRKEGGQFVWFEITDNGPGIPASQQPRIFEPFYSTKRQATGHGFGLSVVYGHVNRHNGLIQLFSIEGHGTTFRVLLPQSEPETVEESTPAPIVSERTVSHNCNVVIVDDQKDVIDVLQHSLSNAGLQTSAFTSSTEALEFLADHPEVGVLMLDILMPEVDGLTMLQEMELKGLTIPVVVMSGYSPATSETLSQFPMVKAVVPKPFRPEQILHVVTQILESRRPEVQTSVG